MSEQGAPPPQGPPGGYGTDLPPGVGLQAYPSPGSGPSGQLGVVAFALGLASLFTWICCIGLPLGVAAIIVGLIVLSRSVDTDRRERNFAIAGIVLGSIGPILWVLLQVAGIATGLMGKF